MNVKKLICFIVMFCSASFGLVAQETAENDPNLASSLYQSYLLQVKSLFLAIPPDSLSSDLLSDAELLAGAGHHADANIILATIIDLVSSTELQEEESTDNVSTNLLMSNGREQNEDLTYSLTTSTSWFQVETGIDYSQQEFEIALIETDSVLIDELQDPYFSLSYYQPLISGQTNLNLDQQLRLDGQFYQYEAGLGLDHNGFSTEQQFDLESGYFYQRDTLQSDFLDHRLAYTIAGGSYGFDRWQVDLRSRLKHHLESGPTASDIASFNGNLQYEKYPDEFRILRISWQPSFYNEFDPIGYRYIQSRFNATFQYLAGADRFVEAQVNFTGQRFDSEIGLELRRNSFISFEPVINAEWRYTQILGFGFDIQAERRTYDLSDGINPDFDFLSVEGMQNLYWNYSNSVGIGGFYETRRHSVRSLASVDFVKQADYDAYGGVVSFDFFDLSGVLVSLQYRASWRNYPSATNTLLNSLYTDRFIHSIGALGWIPINRHWQIQFFGNYDNDRDQIYDEHHSQSTLLNAGIAYKF